MVLCHFCLLGTLPSNIFAGLTKLIQFDASKLRKVVGADDAVGGDCGISGTLPNIRLLGDTSTWWQSGTSLVLNNNRLTGQLPSGLLSMANLVVLDNNMFSGSIPSGRGLSDVVARYVYLAGNGLMVIVVIQLFGSVMTAMLGLSGYQLKKQVICSSVVTCCFVAVVTVQCKMSAFAAQPRSSPQHCRMYRLPQHFESAL
jgi:hypothetical protein